ncbi:hypothetical protein X953_19640 [Virgibacillus sp. SK37]|nr:hypothetical protein X953_19640 [Virgibacillus sp. SK37]
MKGDWHFKADDRYGAGASSGNVYYECDDGHQQKEVASTR